MKFPRGNLRELHFSEILLDAEVLLLLFHFLERAALFIFGHGGLGGSDG